MQHCLAALDYQWPWSEHIARWKYHGDSQRGAALAGLLRAHPDAAQAAASADWVLPLPSASARVAQRGQHPAGLLARALAPDKTRSQWLLRTRDTPPQRGLSLAQRQRNVRRAFALSEAARAALPGRRVLLVDDVMTTGATLREASGCLAQAGAVYVTALVLARTP